MNRDEIKLILRMASVVHPQGRWADSAVIDLWGDLLADVNAADGVAAMRHHLRSSGLPPKPSDIATFASRVVAERGRHPAPPPGRRYAVDIIEEGA